MKNRIIEHIFDLNNEYEKIQMKIDRMDKECAALNNKFHDGLTVKNYAEKMKILYKIEEINTSIKMLVIQLNVWEQALNLAKKSAITRNIC